MLLEALFTGFANFFTDNNSVLMDVVKILAVSGAWIGSLVYYILRKEKQKAKQQAA